jgi:hypothetical protein
VINLDGKSLGSLSRSTAARVSSVIEKEWGEARFHAILSP